MSGVVVKNLIVTKPGAHLNELELSIVDDFQADPAWPIRFEKGKPYAFRCQLLGFAVFFEAKFTGPTFQTDHSSIVIKPDSGAVFS